MRLLGYPAHKISILTTYNGQKNLIRDVLGQRCRSPVFGFPGHVSTVDKYQGQQNDYILLSLVRTASVGHLRDIRRLVVAFSRARLGLYVFCRFSLFQNCADLSRAFGLLSSRPMKLELVVGEGYPCDRDDGDASLKDRQVHAVSDVTEMGVLVYQMVQQAQSMSRPVAETASSDANVPNEKAEVAAETAEQSNSDDSDRDD
jgi:intron-binding protein aquarius